MKKKLRYDVNGRECVREVNYIPFRFYLAIFLAVLETAAILAIVAAMSYFVPYFYLAVWATQIGCVVWIIASDDNPDYKIPWLLVMAIPIAGFMCYLLFYSRTLKKKYIRRLKALKDHAYKKDDAELFARLKEESVTAHNQAKMLCAIAETHLFAQTSQTYFPLGEDLFVHLLRDLEKAEKFIFMEYFIIEEGQFFDAILDVLKRKAAAGVEVKLVYDDIGCMATLPGNYDRILKQYGIEAAPFSRLKGNADSEFNNRNHRKITVIDGLVGYTGGINLADEYINAIEKYGHWKDIGVRIEGEAVKELTRLFLIDFGLNVRRAPHISGAYFPDPPAQPVKGYMVPFGDGPRPIYGHQVGKCVIENLLAQANRYAYIMTPYLIIDNDMCQTIENAAMRGVDVKIIVPHIPDKKLVFEMTRSYYERLMNAGVRIYEYAPGFVHAKSYLVDDELAMIGTINLDYRSLVHHFENGVWMYRCDCIKDMKADFEQTLSRCIAVDDTLRRPPLINKIIRALVRAFAPML